MKSQHWSDQENQEFAKLVELYSKDFKRISEILLKRSYSQVKSHYYNRIKQSYSVSSSISEKVHLVLEPVNETKESVFCMSSNTEVLFTNFFSNDFFE
ncbi:SANT/Myb_domain [Hexamita inflata]|uniref:SANT/Myb domain n=1 Tax=Hexamita inflata TaxID=28002 RepID=A0AA86Q9X5_9EUKA|nr:SANT/Myb domain [Hexamita inflata]CAI9949024.1 SANT/Myb domain [Hexamita inflata]